MAIELKFSKSDAESPWGFRLVGGSDFNQPVVVVKVNKDSFAEAAGLQVGDIIVRVNDTPTARLTHTEVHDLLFFAGLEFNLGIRRGEFSTNISNEAEDYNIEISSILKEAVEIDIINEAVRKVNDVNEKLNGSTPVDIIENLTGQEQILNATTLESLIDTKKEKKWSTFLVKPDKPIPKPKLKVEEVKFADEPYRVVIKKQPRRHFQTKKVQFDENVTELDEEVETEAGENIEMTGQDEVQDVKIEVKMTETEEIPIEEAEVDDEIDGDNGNEGEEINNNVTQELGSNSKSNSIEAKIPWANINIDSSIETSSPLQDQLLSVQKQLQALSQLPSTIQVTLNAISKQLAFIVDAKENSTQNGDREDGSSSTKDEDEPLTEEEILEETEEISEKAEAEINGGNLEDNSSSIDEEIEEDVSREEKVEEDTQETAEEDKELDPYEGLTEEEKEEAIQKEKMEAKKQKVNHWNSVWPWSDRVKTVYRESNCWMVPSKVIATKRINFLKYQPPPKNLDYLQRSEVFRLVHDMEPPVKGITSRPERIPAVQDYYEATKGIP